MSKRLAAVVQCVVFLLLSVVSATQYHDGDYIATAAKAQFDGVRASLDMAMRGHAIQDSACLGSVPCTRSMVC